MAGDDLLSALGDDILRRILHFVPTKEAASTSVLSRRWGSLWRSSGAVNLAVRLHNDKSSDDDSSSFVRAARAALDAADAPVTRLTVRLQADSDAAIYKFLGRRVYRPSMGLGGIDVLTPRDVTGDLLSHPAAHRVEELRVATVVGMDDDTPLVPVLEEETSWVMGNYQIGTLPSQTLRVLDLTGCRELMPRATAAAFPCLETLRLRRSAVDIGYIQALIDAAPRLATMHLESVFFQGTYNTDLRLSCPRTTELVLELCGGDARGRHCCPIEIDAPRLRYFRYKGSQRPFSLLSPAPDMAGVDLHFLQDRGYHHDQVQKEKTLELFWKFVRNFTGTRLLKLKVNYLVDIAVVRETELLCTFRNAVHVELDGVHQPTTKAASLAIANLLHCCPVVRDLRLKLRETLQSDSDSTEAQPFLERKDRLDYDRSVNLFKRRPRLNSIASSGTTYDEAPGAPYLGGHSFTCLQTSLTRVSLQFRMDNYRCLGARLVKFFADNAQVLKEIYVDTGNWKLCEHMNLNVERWIAPTSSKAHLKRRNLAESSWEFSKFARNSRDSRTELRGLATSFTVLPLQR